MIIKNINSPLAKCLLKLYYENYMLSGHGGRNSGICMLIG
jgi:hypothetical protein